MGWREHARCRGVNPSLFYSQVDTDQAVALGLCAVCPVAAACRAEGREYREHGVWGGEDDRSRARALGVAPRARKPPPIAH